MNLCFFLFCFFECEHNNVVNVKDPINIWHYISSVYCVECDQQTFITVLGKMGYVFAGLEILACPIAPGN